jgi:hypothetical protein
MMSRRSTPVHLAGVVAGLAVALASGVVMVLPSGAAGAATTVSDGSDWGPQGLLSSDSSVTLRWDNQGNPTGAIVQRNRLQTLPHTGGKSYDDIVASVRSSYETALGADNGLGGMSVTVSQTADLVDQSITLDFSGVAGGVPLSEERDSAVTMQVFECWGAMGEDGKPDSEAADPDPATCQTGAVGPDGGGAAASGRSYRRVAQDALVRTGDWAKYFGDNDARVPFLAIDGTDSPGDMSKANSYVNPTTTNELSNIVISDSGTAQRTFETQTGSEAPGLGCGHRTDTVSTATCWLVIVPRTSVMGTVGPISPSVWGQRLQVPLHYQDVAVGCPNGQSRELLGGSELLAQAAASWMPGVCEKTKVALGYSRLGDEVARTQYATGASNAILTTQPLAAERKATYVPVALTGAVIGLTLDYQPQCDVGVRLDIARVETEADAKACGYSSLAALKDDRAVAGQPVRDLRLTPVIVAKLLTQSYRSSLPGVALNLPWAESRTSTVFADPQFIKLNPKLHLGDGTIFHAADRLAATLLVEAARSDAAAQIWQWLLADQRAASFLSGCPDAQGMTINPFYSSRTYAGCADGAAALEKQAAKDRAATPTLSSFVDQAITYPPDGSPYPLPEWLKMEGPTVVRPTMSDWLPRVDNLTLTARETFNGGKKANTEWCPTAVDFTCLPTPGKWRAPSGKVATGQRVAFAITDAADAARYQLSTASLCDDDGKHCVAATTTSLHAAVAQFEETATEGVLRAGDADYAGGAYPLTMPVYAAVRPTLPQADRTAYADALAFITAGGQTPGFSAGTLPPGYAPLTKGLTKQAAAGIAALRAGIASSGPDSSTPTPTGSTSTSPGVSTPVTPAGGLPGGVSVPDGATPGVTNVAAPGPTTVTPGALVPTAAGTETWPKYTLPLGLAIALWCGAAGPLMRIRTRLRVSR